MQASPPQVSDTHIHAHVRDMHFYPVDEQDWQGMVMARSSKEAQQILAHLHPSQLTAPATKTQALRHARNAIWALTDPRDSTQQITVKQPIKMHLHKAYLDRFKPSKAKRSWNGAMELMRRGVATANPVAFFEHKQDLSLKKNFYICEFVPADFTIAQAFIALSQGETHYQGYPEQHIYTLFAQFCHHMHQSGIYFRDFSGGNILVNMRPEQQLHFSLIDTARLHAYPNATPFKYRLADLTRALNKLHAQGRHEFLRIYLGLSGKPLTRRHLIPFYLYDFKVTLKRTIGRKAIKRLLRYIKGE
jgi:serine/threonine protein kinase